MYRRNTLEKIRTTLLFRIACHYILVGKYSKLFHVYRTMMLREPQTNNWNKLYLLKLPFQQKMVRYNLQGSTRQIRTMRRHLKTPSLPWDTREYFCLHTHSLTRRLSHSLIEILTLTRRHSLAHLQTLSLTRRHSHSPRDNLAHSQTLSPRDTLTHSQTLCSLYCTNSINSF